MSDPTVEARLAALEASVRTLQDQQAIYQLIASYGLAADGMSRSGLESLWAPDGSYDIGAHVFEDAAAVGGIVEDATHLDYIARGCAHVMSLPRVTIDGDRAVATNYSRVYLKSDGPWTVARAAANRWELARDDGGRWRVTRRINRLLDGSEAGRSLLAAGLDPA